MANILVSISIEHTVHRNNSYPGSRRVLLSSECTRMVRRNNRRFPHIHRPYLHIRRNNACDLHHNLAPQQDCSNRQERWREGSGRDDASQKHGCPYEAGPVAHRGRAAIRKVFLWGNSRENGSYASITSEEIVHIKMHIVARIQHK